MFDVHVQKVMPHYAQTVTKHEHRATTDASIQILREMEQKARDNILLAIRSDSNNFKYNATVQRDHFGFTHSLRLQFSLNGHAYDTSVDLPDYHTLDKQKLIRKIRDLIAERLATKIVIDLLPTDVLAGVLT